MERGAAAKASADSQLHARIATAGAAGFMFLWLAFTLLVLPARLPPLPCGPQLPARVSQQPAALEGRVFVYDLPPQFNSESLDALPACASSMFAAEVLFHRFLLRSRFLAPRAEEAALFFVPVYSTCGMLAHRAYESANTNPHLWQQRLVREALEWVQTHASTQWDRLQGSDHVLLFTHDFGACLDFRDLGKGPPLSALRHVISAQPNGEFGAHSTCFSPHKDVTIPPVSPFNATAYAASLPLLRARVRALNDALAAADSEGAARQPRRVYFRGTIEWLWFGRRDPEYSRGVRQAIAAHYQDSAAYPHFFVAEGAAPQEQYAAELAQATFCLCPRGYAAWSPRLVDAMLFGCVPVLIGDHALPPLADQLDYSSFAVFVSEADAKKPGRLAALLDSLPEERLRAKQLRLLDGDLWSRFSYFASSAQRAPRRPDGRVDEDALVEQRRAAVEAGGCGACEAIVESLARRVPPRT